jgi:putative membrane protein
MRHAGSLPSSGLKLPIVVILGIVCLAVVLGLLL